MACCRPIDGGGGGGGVSGGGMDSDNGVGLARFAARGGGAAMVAPAAGLQSEERARGSRAGV